LCSRRTLCVEPRDFAVPYVPQSPTLLAHAATRTEFHEHAIVKPYTLGIRSVKFVVENFSGPDEPRSGMDLLWIDVARDRATVTHLTIATFDPNVRRRIFLLTLPSQAKDPAGCKRNGIIVRHRRNQRRAFVPVRRSPLFGRTMTYARPCAQRCARSANFVSGG